MQRFGEKVRTLRKRHGMTATQLAEALGYAASSNSYISEVETGKRRPKIEFVLKVSRFFDVSADTLIKDELDLEDNS